MSDRDTALDATIDGMRIILGLEVREAWRPGVKSSLDTSLQFWAKLLEHDLPGDCESAPQFDAFSRADLAGPPA